jgi:hypothetical protein
LNILFYDMILLALYYLMLFSFWFTLGFIFRFFLSGFAIIQCSAYFIRCFCHMLGSLINLSISILLKRIMISIILFINSEIYYILFFIHTLHIHLSLSFSLSLRFLFYMILFMFRLTFMIFVNTLIAIDHINTCTWFS